MSQAHHISTAIPTLNLDTTVNTGALLWPEGSSWDFSSGSVGNSTLSRGSWDCCRSVVSSAGTGSYWERTRAAGEGRCSTIQGPASRSPSPRKRASRGGQAPSLRCKLMACEPADPVGLGSLLGRSCLISRDLRQEAQEVTLDSGEVFRREDAQQEAATCGQQ